MSLLDGLLGQIAGNVDIKNLAEKVGISPDQAEAAVVALGQAHSAPGDTVDTAAANSGLSTDVLQQIVGHIGGEGSLGQFASLLQGAAASGVLGSLLGGSGGNAGGLGGTLAGLAGGLFGGNKS